MKDMLQQNVDITHLSNFKTPARTRYFYTVSDRESLTKLQDISCFASRNNLPLLIVSSGTNMLFAFDVYQGIIVHNTLSWWSYDRNTKILESYGSESIWEIAEILERDYWQDIWHRFIGLPGSVAGAVYGNAGCFGLETSSNFVSCEVYNMSNWEIQALSASDMDFSYRHSMLKDNTELYLISARFDLSVVREKYSSDVDNIYFREHMQPKWNSCWSFFKNPKINRQAFLSRFPELSDICPKNISAWFLLEQLWLKWYPYGWAYFSDMHANFLMHNGQWTWTDIVYLISLAQSKVQEKFWIYLENEVQIIHSP
jgi:UDP-N-acetylmuramate dehydrogenase